MIIALASPGVAATIEEGLGKIRALMSEASNLGAEIVCFPEAYLPGLRGQGCDVPEFTLADFDTVLATVGEWAANRRLGVILGLERPVPAGRQIVACVIDEHGSVLGTQTKNQLDPSEDRFYVPGETRSMFEVNGLRFGITICHEGWRYPETVRWASVRGASIVFHQSYTGSDRAGVRLAQWGSPEAPYYEKAMVCRALENTIYFASVNYALKFQDSATAVIGPSGDCQAWLPYGQEGVLAHEIRPESATGLLASRFAPDRLEGEPAPRRG